MKPLPDGGQLLKADALGVVILVGLHDARRVRRDTRRAAFGCGWLARRLARREARALAALDGVAGTPRLFRFDGLVLEREWLPGEPLHRAPPADHRYFSAALTLLRRLHRARVTHDDLAKEPNWLVQPDGSPALVDFQLAHVHRRRGRLFRVLAREDLRYLLKHKRTYCAERLTGRQRRMLATPAWTSRLWRATGKRAYLFVTRRLLGWTDREGAGDRPLR